LIPIKRAASLLVETALKARPRSVLFRKRYKPTVNIDEIMAAARGLRPTITSPIDIIAP
jgi:hypothetical protein